MWIYFILFVKILGSKENSHFSISASRCPLIRTSITTNIPIYIKTVQCKHFNPADAIVMGKSA
jgi:hypothetical protein